MFQELTVDQLVGRKIIKANEEERAKHVSSGKLSASMLGQPVQWQVLKMIGVPPKEIDQYVLRKFKRGNDIEDWLTKEMPGLMETQKEATYRDCVGFIDAIVDTKDYSLKCGTIPHEVKSVSNAKYRRVTKAGEADSGHLLQACLYALSEGTDHFAIDYVSTDDLRITTYVMETKDHKFDVDQAISAYEKAREDKKVPAFVAKERWQSMPNYCNFPDWMELAEEQIVEKLKKEHEEPYKKLIS